MDDRGLIFTIDSVLALIPVFLIIFAITNISDSGISSIHHVNSIHNAQDLLEVMSNQNKLGDSVLLNIANILSRNGNSDKEIKEAGEIAESYLNTTLKNTKYSLMETNKLNKTIASNGDIKNAHEISVGFKTCKNYIFKLFIWN